jgi:1,4-alpha-glucan branching enzyme
VWAPHATNVSVAGNFNGWDMAANPLASEGNGCWSADCTNAAAGAEYKYVINSNLWRRDPRGLSVVNSAGNSIVFDPDAYDWDVDSFARPERKDEVIYAMHVRTFNPQWSQWPQGTFETALAKLDHLQELGVNAIELMPIMEFPGDNSWGYNPSDPYAVESAYGGSRKLQEFVDACHTRKLAVILDVVHNHWGPSDLATWQFDGYAPVAEYGGIYHYNTAGLCCTDWGATGRTTARRKSAITSRTTTRPGSTSTAWTASARIRRSTSAITTPAAARRATPTASA